MRRRRPLHALALRPGVLWIPPISFRHEPVGVLLLQHVFDARLWIMSRRTRFLSRLSLPVWLVRLALNSSIGFPAGRFRRPGAVESNSGDISSLGPATAGARVWTIAWFGACSAGYGHSPVLSGVVLDFRESVERFSHSDC